MKVMKRGLLATLAVFGMLVVIVGIVYAFTIGSVDGVWGLIDGTVETSIPEQIIDVIGVVGNYNIPVSFDQTRRRNAPVCVGDPDGDSSFGEWSFIWPLNISDFGAYTGCNTAASLFFSEYAYDQQSGDDGLALEIYNGTGAAVDLSQYSIRIYGNDGSVTTYALSNENLGNLATWVIENDRIVVPGNQTNIDTTGNPRTIVLFKEGTVVEGANCSNWATGPGANPTNVSATNPGIQTPPNTDENQVRYGNSGGTCSTGIIGSQSGFGFDGIDGNGTKSVNVPFPVGTFTHYNNPINASDIIQDVPLTITLPITCNGTVTEETFSFTPTFSLEETPNTGPYGSCPYTLLNSATPCPDKVTVGNSSSTQTFTCPEGGQNVEYTVAIYGFVPGPCGTFNGNVSTEFITAESANTVACVWGEITSPKADIAVTKTCHLDTSSMVASLPIVTTNFGDGAAVEPTLTDTLPTGATYNSFTSELTTSTGTTNSGSCTNTAGTVDCALNTLLPAPVAGFESTWTVTLNISTAQEISNTVNVSSISTDPNMANNSSTATCSPTAVTLTSFTASELNGTVALDWKTAFERGTQGFNIYLSQTMDGEKVKVNDKLIPSKAAPGSLRGASYTYTAGQALTGEYYFWLEEVETSGNSTQYGPAVLIIK